MYQKNIVSIQLPEGVLDQIKRSIREDGDLLSPHLVALTEDEKSTLTKMSDGTLAFVQKAYDYCIINPEFVPVYLDVVEMKKDLVAYTELKPLLDMLANLHSDLRDTLTMAGSEAFTAARTYYNSVSYAAKTGSLSAKPIAEDLSMRFPGGKRQKPGAKPEESK
jgi:hypothetical protein